MGAISREGSGYFKLAFVLNATPPHKIILKLSEVLYRNLQNFLHTIIVAQSKASVLFRGSYVHPNVC
jgi:hypothetical protein